MDTDLEFFRKRIISLKDKAYQNDFVLLPFLDDSKCYLIAKAFKKNEDLKYYFYGGYDEADYKRCIFSYEEVNNELFQIDILKIDYAKKNYSLNHRSILGSVLGLGLKREVVGDIINNDDDYYIFVSKNISDFIIDNLGYVGSTPIKVYKCPKLDFKVKKNYLEKDIFVASLRLDVIIAGFLNLSRKEALNLILEQRVKLNHLETLNSSVLLKENDLISVRGYGRIIVDKIKGHTKSNNIILHVKKPI